jgi:hypothetical protein
MSQTLVIVTTVHAQVRAHRALNRIIPPLSRPADKMECMSRVEDAKIRTRPNVTIVHTFQSSFPQPVLNNKFIVIGLCCVNINVTGSVYSLTHCVQWASVRVQHTLAHARNVLTLYDFIEKFFLSCIFVYF